MRIFFFDSGNPKLGSNRIYVKNLSNWIKPYVKKIRISKKFEAGYDFYICSKFCTFQDLEEIKLKNNNSKIGLIHPSNHNDNEIKKLKIADFFIVGSIEEKVYLESYTNNIIRFPQIEDYSLSLKKHIFKKKIILGYHGNYQNLIGSNQNYIRAIEKLSKFYDLELYLIYDKSLGKFKNKKIKFKIIDWSEKNLIRFLSKIDIGLVPATNNLYFDKDLTTNIFIKTFKYIFSKFGKSTDYIIQFKYNSNPGRSHLYHQAGIPVVAGFWPSHFELLSNSENGFLAHSRESWVSSIEKLIKSHQLRNKLSRNAYKIYKKNYDPKIWTVNFYKYLKYQKNNNKIRRNEN